MMLDHSPADGQSKRHSKQKPQPMRELGPSFLGTESARKKNWEVELTSGIFRPIVHRESTDQQAIVAESGYLLHLLLAFFPILSELLLDHRSPDNFDLKSRFIGAVAGKLWQRGREILPMDHATRNDTIFVAAA
jgi:hypothetical protein